MGTEEVTAEKQKRCFVVMGFGVKTDFATGRKLDLNKSYRLLIKPVVEEKGLICIRADEIAHSGSIDAVMYQELLSADVVIADLSTANLNAVYELGIRHALRPRTTIVISEDKLTYPFDLNHVSITSYTHLGDAIDYEEVERFRKKLGETLQAVMNGEKPDSPVYTYLQRLTPPSLKAEAEEAVAALAAGTAIENVGSKKNGGKRSNKLSDKTLALLTDQGEGAIRQREYGKAKSFFSSALLIGKAEGSAASNDSYLVHRLAFATYKAEEPDTVSALKEAIRLLHQLDLNHTNDPETVSLAGAIEKCLFEKGEGDEHLNEGILYYQRGFYLLHNRYNGINLAFLLYCRANSSLYTRNEDRIADKVYAERAWHEVLTMCERDFQQIAEREQRVPKPGMQGNVRDDLSATQLETDIEQKFWILANRAEASLGLGNLEGYESAYAAARAVPHQTWMMDAVDAQINNLKKVVERLGEAVALW